MAKYSTQGVELRYGDGGSSETFTAIAQISDFNINLGSKTVLDATDLDSVREEKVMGLARGAQATFTIFYDPADTTHQFLQTEFNDPSPSVVNYQVGLDTGASPEPTINFSGYVNGFEVGSTVDSLQTVNVTLELTGSITFPS